MPIYVSATYIFLFILFGSFLERAGMIQLFTDVALGLVGRTRGGPAKVAVFASGMMGTISGSGVANVVTVGQFTIPLMKRFGYRRAFAARRRGHGLDGRPDHAAGDGRGRLHHGRDAQRARTRRSSRRRSIPAMLYFASAFWMVHLEAGKHGLVGLKRSEIPSPWKALVTRWYLVLPLAALVYMLFDGFTPMFAGSIGLALTVALILGASIAARPSRIRCSATCSGSALALVGRRACRATGFEIVPVACVVVALIVICRLHPRRARDACAPAATRSPTAPSRRSPSAWPAPSSASSSA